MKNTHDGDSLSPLRRLIRILHPERRTINYIFLYAFIIGIFSLSIPVGITAIFNLLSNGAIYSSTYILIAIVLTGVVLGGVMLVGQLSLVEYLEQKIFLKFSLEFAYRLTRIKKSELEGESLPELINRFFDVIIIQKGLIKLLIDIISAVVTVCVSVVLLSFYHPFFVIIGIFVIVILALIIVLYYKQGVNTSIEESEYKYQTVAYLEEVATNIDDYRNNDEMKAKVVAETDRLTSKYLGARNDHFKILKRFFGTSVIIRTFLFGAMLLLGSYFVVERQMTFGQFVAAEIVIVQIGYAIEKFLTSLDTIFDMVTGSEKLAVITDLELEEEDLKHG